MKQSLTVLERRDMENYVNHSMNIGDFEGFVANNRKDHGIVYRGIRLHQQEVFVGSIIKHFEPLLSCSEEVKVSETFAVCGIVPEDIVADKARMLGRDEDEEFDVTYEEFIPVVLSIRGVYGVRILDYLDENYEYASEKEIVLLNEPLVITSIQSRATDFNEDYMYLRVCTLSAMEWDNTQKIS